MEQLGDIIQDWKTLFAKRLQKGGELDYMGSVNKVILIGNLTRDPELRQSEERKAVCTFGVATNRNYTDGDGKKHEDTDFHRIVAFGKLGEFCNQYLRKGRKVYLEQAALGDSIPLRVKQR